MGSLSPEIPRRWSVKGKLLIIGVVMMFHICAGCTEEERKDAPMARQAGISCLEAFAPVFYPGWQVGSAVLTSRRGALVISCRQELPITIDALIDMPGVGGSVYAEFSFHLPHAEDLRVSKVYMETNLPSVGAYASVSPDVLNAYEPQSRFLLEFELLVSAVVLKEGSDPVCKAMVRSRIVRLIDDLDLGLVELDVDGLSWLEQTLVVPGSPGGAARTIEHRACKAMPWGWTCIDLPPTFLGWLVRKVTTTCEVGEPLVLSLAHGYYENVPARWGSTRSSAGTGQTGNRRQVNETNGQDGNIQQ
jgi:hypothetical protein